MGDTSPRRRSPASSPRWSTARSAWASARPRRASCSAPGSAPRPRPRRSTWPRSRAGLAAGVSHWRLNNIDHRLVLRLAIPGAVGALRRRRSSSPTSTATTSDRSSPILLMLVGIRILFRFSQALPESRDAGRGRGRHRAGTPVQRDRRRGRRRGRRGHERTRRRVGPGRHAVPAPPRPPAALRDRLGQHRRGRGRRRLGGHADHDRSVAAGSRSASCSRCSSVASLAAPLAAYVVRFVPARLLGLDGRRLAPAHTRAASSPPPTTSPAAAGSST